MLQFLNQLTIPGSYQAYYAEYVQQHLRREFPTFVGYHRFIELMPALLVPLVAYLQTHLGACRRADCSLSLFKLLINTSCYV